MPFFALPFALLLLDCPVEKTRLKLRLRRLEARPSNPETCAGSLETSLPSLESALGKPDYWKLVTPETSLRLLGRLKIRLGALED